jgi:hypothetical protein
LGIKDLYLQNEALLLVNLIWNTYYQHKVPHLALDKGSFWWKDILKLHEHFREVTQCLTGMGVTVGLWEDSIQGQPFSIQFPNLYTYADNRNTSLKDSLAATNLLDIFLLPMSRQAHNEFLIFKDCL